MKKGLVGICSIVVVVSQLQGCANLSQTEQGAGIGAVAGGALGAAVSKNKGQGFLVGAALGAVAGGLIGNYMDKQNASRAEAAKRYQYDQRESKLEVESAAITPPNVPAGGNMNAAVQYTTLQPNNQQEVRITETRTLLAGKETYDLGKREVTKTQGTHTSTAKLSLPSDLPKGAYTLVTTISDGKNVRTAKSTFMVV